MTNGNSRIRKMSGDKERERFEKWIGQKRPDESGMEQYSWDDCWSAWEAALSVCADGGKDALGWAWERRYSNGGYTRKFCTSEFEARELAKDSESLSIPDLVYPFFARADGGKGEAVARVNDEGFIVETGALPLAPGMQLFAAPQAECAPRAAQLDAWNALTDDDRKAAFESLPDMLEGFLKKWGWLNFAKEIEKRCKEKNAAPIAPRADCGETLPGEFTNADDMIAALRADADTAGAKDLLSDHIELNMSNYNEDDVSALNEWAIRAHKFIAAGASNERADDLSALVARLARALRKAAPDNDLSEKALDYLKREGLIGSPLRADAERKYTAAEMEQYGKAYADARDKRADAEKDAALTALAGLVHVYVGLCRDSVIDPRMNTQYRNARAILAANKGK